MLKGFAIVAIFAGFYTLGVMKPAAPPVQHAVSIRDEAEKEIARRDRQMAIEKEIMAIESDESVAEAIKVLSSLK